MAEFPATIALSSLNGSNGFEITGGAAYDNNGRSVSSAGDVNGDGFDDLIVGAPFADPNGNGSGASYVVFGKAGGFGSTLPVSSLNGSNGFKINGVAVNDYSGWSVSSAGDVNGDGFADLIVGAFAADPNGARSGASYVVFGKAGGFGSSLDLSSLNGSTGFRINGEAAGDQSGTSVSSAGDMNGDGFDDLIVGAPFAAPNGDFSGSSYVVFGKAGGFTSSLDPSSLNGSNGFEITGEASLNFSGWSVSSAGDVNGDGFADLVVGAYGATPNGDFSGASYVVFGKAGGFTSSLDLSSLNGTNGFKINGEAAGDYSGFSVSSAGDVNGDGLADLIIGAPLANLSYVVFGKAGGLGASVDLSSLNGTNGFELNGKAAGGRSGHSVSSAGDVNGDGFADLIVGAYGANAGATQSGASYVVFGKAGGFGASFTLASLNGRNGFEIAGEADFDQSGFSVSSAGDVNGDGFDDLVVGAYGTDAGGYDAGSSYVVFGRAPDAAVTRTGTAQANIISGGAFADTLNGLGGNDTLKGNAGNDRLNGGAGADVLIGGAGSDTALYTGSGQGVIVDLTLSTAQSGGEAAGDTLDGIENVQGSAFADRLTGDGIGNRLDGGIGADTLSGAGGADTLVGGAGNDDLTGGAGADAFYVDSAGDTLHESANAGMDSVYAGVDYTLADGQAIEYLRADAGSTGLRLAGNDLSNFVVGGAGADTLEGGSAGTDRLYGGAGNDTYVIGRGGIGVYESANAGTDTVQASVGTTLKANVENLTLTGGAAINGTGNALANVLTGNGATNTLQGKDGDDTLAGGGGADRLFGGAGSDVFVYQNTTDSALSARDGIYDFVEGGTDKIDLSGIDANQNAGATGDQAFTLITGGYTGVAGQLRTFSNSTVTYVEGDVNGDRTADFQIVLSGVHGLQAGDFVL